MLADINLSRQKLAQMLQMIFFASLKFFCRHDGGHNFIVLNPLLIFDLIGPKKDFRGTIDLFLDNNSDSLWPY